MGEVWGGQGGRKQAQVRMQLHEQDQDQETSSFPVVSVPPK